MVTDFTNFTLVRLLGGRSSFDDDSGDLLNSRITYTATTSGTYYLGAEAAGSGTGAYKISARSFSVDVSPYKPSGWSDKIVVSNTTGANIDSSIFYSDQILYIDWAANNAGVDEINSIFYTTLYLDGIQVTRWNTSSLPAGRYVYVNDYSLGVLTVGNHTIKIITDATGVISETNESNNEFTRAIVVAARPFLDTTPPTIAVGSDKTSLSSRTTATLMFTLSENSTNFVAADLTVSGGTISNFTGSGTSYTATFTPTANSTTSGVVTVASSVFTDAAGNANADGSDANNKVTFSVDTVVPTVSKVTPTSSSVAAVTDNIVINFSESVVKGSGNVTLKTAAGATVGTFDISSSSNLSLVGSTLTLNPTADLSYGTSYIVDLASGLITDAAGNSFVSGSSYAFSTASAPIGKSLTYATGNDVISGTTGSDTIDAGAGVDTVVYTGAKSAYTIINNTTSVTVSSGADGLDTLKNVERLKFSDATVAVDIDGTAGQCYRIYKAAFARTPDLGGVGYWISVMDKGTSLQSVAGGFIDSTEFKSVYGTNPTNDALVTKFYTNVLGRAPDATGAAYWTGILNNKQDTVANVLANISESAENKASLVGVIGNGFEYTPYG